MADLDPQDVRLVAAYRAGEKSAFDRIYDRYHATLLRYARRILGGDRELAEDVVQEALWRASRALLRDEREMHLKPWLFRLVRNCALDELSRVRTDGLDVEAMDAAGALRAPFATQPEEAAERRSHLRTVLGDVASLPAPQRHALLRRELDGVPVAQLATEMGLTPQATKSLVFRARTNLVKQRDARTTTCADVQRALLQAHDDRHRAPASAHRHIAGCRECREFRRGLRSTRRAMHLLSPGPLLLAGAGVFGTLKLLTGAASASTAKTAATTAAGVAIAAGAVGAGVQVFSAGEPAPQDVDSVVLTSRLAAGDPIPRGVAVVRQSVRLPAGPVDQAPVTLPCPKGLRVADLLPSTGARVSATYSPDTIPGASTRATIVVAPATLSAPATLRLGVLCKRPDAAGSILPGTDRTAYAAGAAPLRHVAVRTAWLRERPGGDPIGSVRRGQPVRLDAEPRGGWQRVVTDADARGWVPVSALR